MLEKWLTIDEKKSQHFVYLSLFYVVLYEKIDVKLYFAYVFSGKIKEKLRKNPLF